MQQRKKFNKIRPHKVNDLTKADIAFSMEKRSRQISAQGVKNETNRQLYGSYLIQKPEFYMDGISLNETKTGLQI